MQNLVTMNLVDVILHTRARVGRLVDWIDQAFLLVHLDPLPGDADPARPDAALTTRCALRRIGVRTATDLLRAFDGGRTDGSPLWSADALRARGLDPEQLTTVCRLLADEPGLDPVRHWKAGGSPRTAALTGVD